MLPDANSARRFVDILRAMNGEDSTESDFSPVCFAGFLPQRPYQRFKSGLPGPTTAIPERIGKRCLDYPFDELPTRGRQFAMTHS